MASSKQAGNRSSPGRPWLIGAAVALALLLVAYALPRFLRGGTVEYADPVTQFYHGSIGSEPESGLPYWVWKALPDLFAPELGGKGFEQFGFLYERDAEGKPADLPIGFSRRRVMSVDLVWMNCAICHTGTYRTSPDAPPVMVPAMPAKALDLYRFIRFVLDIAGDPRLAPEPLFAAMERAGARFDWVDRLVWRFGVFPKLKDGLANYRARLLEMMRHQPPWGPGRVDSFNPYKTLVFGIPFEQLKQQPIVGTVDMPAIFEQAPRVGMHLHWDGNNVSIVERNLFAAQGAGVRDKTVDFRGIALVLAFMLKYIPPPNPAAATLDPALASRGKALYLRECARCHGHAEPDGYRYEGERLGQVEDIANLGTDRARLDTFTDVYVDRQGELYPSHPGYRFTHFRKTNGYTNLPLDGLWLRGPYLHNGSVPTVRQLLDPATRPRAFTVGTDLLDPRNIGSVWEPCTPDPADERDGSCRDTARVGNGNEGHLYGAQLSAGEKDALIEYLKTF